jgi:hypothetical protein
MTKSTTPCVFCGGTGSLSTEHVIPRWLRKALMIKGPVLQYTGTVRTGSAQTLSIVFHEVCARCNSGWLERLETAARPVLEQVLLGAAPGTAVVLDPDQQAAVATWAVKTALLLNLGEFRGADHGWIPASTLQWLHEHSGSRMPPPGARVWIGGFNTSNVPARVQAACLYADDGSPCATCVTFSAGRVLFQVFATEQEDANLSPDNETWLAPKDAYAQALVRIAPSSAAVRWPPEAVFGAGDLDELAGRLRQGLPAKS